MKIAPSKPTNQNTHPSRSKYEWEGKEGERDDKRSGKKQKINSIEKRKTNSTQKNYTKNANQSLFGIQFLVL